MGDMTWLWVVLAISGALAVWFTLWLKPWIDDHYDENESGD